MNRLIWNLCGGIGVAIGLWAVNRETDDVSSKNELVVVDEDVSQGKTPRRLGRRASVARDVNGSGREIFDPNVRQTSAVEIDLKINVVDEKGDEVGTPVGKAANNDRLLQYDHVHLNGKDVPLFLKVTGVTKARGSVSVRGTGWRSETLSPKGTSATFEIDRDHINSILDTGKAVFDVDYNVDGIVHHAKVPVSVQIDTRGPFLEVVRIKKTQFSTGTSPTATVTMELEFESGDLDHASAETEQHYWIERVGSGGRFDAGKAPNSATHDAASSPGVVTLEVHDLPRGTYRLSVLPSSMVTNSPSEAADSETSRMLVDQAGNVAGGRGSQGQRMERYFGIEPEAEPGEHVEFPEFLPTAPQPDFQRRINPGDRVETRVMRMFYFRDAHRVAQLINRTAESLNKQPVKLAERRAEDARVGADRKTDERRQQELIAVEAAEELRRQENEVQAMDTEYTRFEAEARRHGVLIDKLQRDKEAIDRDRDLTSEEKTKRKEQLDAQIEEAQGKQEKATLTTNQLAAAVQKDRADLAEARKAASRENRKTIEMQAKEDRAREEQFRLEVAAAHEDPDTYAAAKKNSVDPVAQCSVSVMGEGLLQIRGPRKGIDKIRTMIHQIDMPLGQVKVEIVTVQINGERGDRMERPLGRVDAHLGLGRFMTAQSLMLLRQAIVAEAALIAQEYGNMGHMQVDRDRKYLYGFFGRDFIDELYAMESEFLSSENKILGLHSMDSVSLHQALFVLALAKNDVRQRILERFMQMVQADLVQAEFDFRRSSELWPHKTGFHLPHTSREHREEKVLRRVCLNNAQRYHFRNLRTFFAASPMLETDTINPLQREFIKLAQIFKSRLITEMELKQRIIERAMIEDDREFDIQAEEQAANSIRTRVLNAERDVQRRRFDAAKKVSELRSEGDQEFSKFIAGIDLESAAKELAEYYRPLVNTFAAAAGEEDAEEIKKAAASLQQYLERVNQYGASPEIDAVIESLKVIQSRGVGHGNAVVQSLFGVVRIGPAIVKKNIQETNALRMAVQTFLRAADPIEFNGHEYYAAMSALDQEINRFVVVNSERRLQIAAKVKEIRDAMQSAVDQLMSAEGLSRTTEHFLKGTRRSLKHRKLLDFFIEEDEERLIDLLEGTRAQVSQMDNYLKRMMTALEDDFNIQFYDPAFVRIRSAAREWDVTLGQVERTSILTNNRAFAKVTPQATMEFDLPKRKIAIVEAFDGAKAMLQDYGALANDPTFLAAAQLMGAGPSNGKVQNLYPGLPTSTDTSQMGVTGAPPNASGSALQALVPDPSIYKFETGTGFEIRPVIQPDGHSIIYDFNYMYTTNVREPVKADEKHLGRIKRHFINTQVQTSSFDMREISRYHVALKASRTSKGVPMFEDIPVLGMAFRPLPSDESSIQQNVILGRTVVYPTVFDLMGLRWAPSVANLSHESVRDAEHVVRGRYQSVRNSIDEISRQRFDDLIGIPQDATKIHHRPDLYYRRNIPSPYHPSGYHHQEMDSSLDRTGNSFRRRDPRPQEFRQPYYDNHGRPQPASSGGIMNEIPMGYGYPGPNTPSEGAHFPVEGTVSDSTAIEFIGPGYHSPGVQTQREPPQVHYEAK